MERQKIDSSLSKITTEQITSLIAHFSIKPTPISKLPSDDIKKFINEAIQERKIFFSSLKELGNKIGLNHPWDSMNNGGANLHLSDSYREEHVTKWLKWIICPPFFSESRINKNLKPLIQKIFLSKSDENDWGQFIKLETEVEIDPEYTLIEEMDKPKTRSLDLVAYFEKKTIIFEIKINDEKLNKNWIYHNYISQNINDFPNPEYCLIAREDKIRKYKESNKSFKVENKNKTKKTIESQEVLTVFPYVTWESIIYYLQSNPYFDYKIKNRDDKETLWLIHVASFVSFIEYQVLGIDLEELSDIFSHSSDLPPNVEQIKKLEKYLMKRSKGIYEKE